METNRKLPVINIAGTAFEVDVARQTLLEKGNVDNTISFDQMRYKGTHYELDYSPESRNLPSLFEYFITVPIAQMKEIDPQGMAMTYNRSLDEIKKHSDFELIVDQEVLEQRLSGRQPVINIAGHPFFVDINVGFLRPKDDFSTLGISIRELQHHANFEDEAQGYIIPYSPARHEMVQVDWERAKEVPKSFVMIELPPIFEMDPVRYAQENGLDVVDTVRRYPPQLEMQARVIPWDETPIKEIIKKNLEREKNNIKSELPKEEVKRKKGKSL